LPRGMNGFIPLVLEEGFHNVPLFIELDRHVVDGKGP
jgi:hypothetical protein